MLKNITSDSIHRICSSQVVSSLAIAVKELIENALDAGATKLDVKLINKGLSLTVSDNGKGIKEQDHSSVAVKHATSKISGFKDLESVGSYGFRGEALSSLAFLSNLEITTRTADENIGWVLKYDKEGKLDSSSRQAREVGTSVFLGDLFQSLPVRYREYKKNIKREYQRLLSLLQAYAVVCENVKISVLNRGKAVLRTHGKDLMNNIGSVFGWKQVKTIKKLDFEFDGVIIRGYLSDPKEFGKRTTERQMFFMKSRPVDMPKLQRLINHEFRARCPNRSPFIVLNINLPEGTYDLNVTPDKRTVFIHNENQILAEIKKHLNTIWDVEQQSYKLAQSATQVTLDQSWQDTSVQILAQSKQVKTPTKGESSSLKKWSSPTNQSIKSPFAASNYVSPTTSKSTSNPFSDFKSPNTEVNPTSSSKKRPAPNGQMSQSRKRVKLNFSGFDIDEAEVVNCKAQRQENLEPFNVPNEIVAPGPFMSKPTKSEPLSDTICNLSNVKDELITEPTIDDMSQVKEDETINITLCSSFVKNNIEEDDEKKAEDTTETIDQGLEKQDIEIATSMESIRARFISRYTMNHHEKAGDEAESSGGSGDIREVGKNLRRIFEKNSFQEMRIIGQFNLGFILATHNGDLFIIDQHATDEKYNFEMIKKTTSLTSQPMINPIRLHIPRQQELKVIDNLKVFERNGFRIKVDSEAKPCEQLLITSMPFAKGKTFSEDDVHELIALLNEEADPSTILMPKAIALYAMKACRTSMMVGTALSKTAMKKIVDHMSGLVHPWNCPHGRPTMRHLYSLNTPQDSAKEVTNISWQNLTTWSK